MSTTPIRFAHISDLHVLDLGDTPLTAFFNKRLTGGATLLLGRKKGHPVEVTEALVDDLQKQNLDHVVVTGDLTNLSLPSEFRRAHGILSQLGGPGDLTVIPGNHDHYVPDKGDGQSFNDHFSSYLQSTEEKEDSEIYPVLKIMGPLALIGLSSALPTPWFFATGRVGQAQLERLSKMLANPEVASRTKVVLVHHPLLDEPSRQYHRLRELGDAKALQKVLAAGGVDLVLHGHNHYRYKSSFTQEGVEVPVHGASSSSHVGTENPRTLAGYAIYEVDGKGDKGVIEVEARRYDEQSGGFARVSGPEEEPGSSRSL